ncbi:MAG: hypothetical protein H7249_11370 [Chitinophagaceae bacterium]|nr:hypothetical protein [Oligoflexus sp.]
MMKSMGWVWSLAFAMCATSACVSNQEQFSNSIEADSSDGIGTAVEAQSQQGLSARPNDGYSLEWFSCTRSAKAPVVVMLNTTETPFKAGACKTGLAQAFLQQDYNVIALNRPGFGQSEGKEVLGDDKTVKSVQTYLKDAQDQGKNIEALWGFEEASILAFRVAKNSKLKLLIVGNGIYEWDATVNGGKDPAYASQLKALAGTDPSFAEKRSVAWDFSGLPKSVYLYHMQNQTRYPEAQAEAFRAALAANQYSVKLIQLKDDKAILTPVGHQSVLMQIAQAQKLQK